MRASEWQFLCAVHETPKSCCAIDYCCHTLDWATNIVTSQKIFPSRLSLGAGDGMDDRGAGVKHLVNIFRRLHRIFAHAWFQHREVFWRVEGQTGLYVLFKTVCDNYELLPAENYKLPPEAEGLEPTPETKPVPTILKPDSVPTIKTEHKVEEDTSSIGVGRTNTRRHIRSSPSTGSAVTTVLEADEDDSGVTQKLVDMHIAEDEAEPEAGDMEATTQKTHVETEDTAESVPESTSITKEGAQPEPHAEVEPGLPIVTPSGEESGKVEEPVEEDKVEANPEVEATIPVVIEDEKSATVKDNQEPKKSEPTG
jgi:hypothetical protein